MTDPDTTPGEDLAPASAATTATRPRFPFGAAVLGLIVLVALTFVYRRYSLTFPVNADLANDILEGQAIVHGNILLHNWVLTTISFYMEDPALYAIGMLVRGSNPVLLHEVPVIVFVTTLSLSVWLSSWRYKGRAAAMAAAATFVLMGMPVRDAAWTCLMGPFHAGLMAYAMLAFAAIDGFVVNEKRLPIWRLAVFTLALVAAEFSDDMTTYSVILPVLIICGLRLRGSWAMRANEISIMTAAVLVVVMAKALQHAVPLVGGFVISPVSTAANISFVKFEDFPQNISWTIQGLLAFVGADFFGLKLSLTALFCLIGLIPLAVLFRGMISTLTQVWRGETNFDRVSGILAVGMAIDLLSYVLSTLPIGIYTLRYFIPFLFMGAVLAGRLIGASFPKQRTLYVALALAGLVGVVHLARQVRVPYAAQPARDLAEWLAAHHLTNGYGGYWCSADTTVFSRGEVRVRPIIAVNGKIVPYLWGVNQAWYGDPANFVVVKEDQDNPGIVRALPVSFGAASQSYVVGPYKVFVYSHDVTPLLPPIPK